MEQESIFLKLEGNNVKNRIWNFLIVHSEFDYSMKDIAKHSNISYSAAKITFKEFTERNILKKTREVGNAKMYILNRDTPLVEKFIDYYWTVVESGIKKDLYSKEKEKLQEPSDVPIST